MILKLVYMFIMFQKLGSRFAGFTKQIVHEGPASRSRQREETSWVREPDAPSESQTWVANAPSRSSLVARAKHDGPPVFGQLLSGTGLSA